MANKTEECCRAWDDCGDGWWIDRLIDSLIDG